MKRILPLVAAAISFAGIATWIGGASAQINVAAAETVSANTYRIASQGMTITAPEGWHVAQSDELAGLMGVAGRLHTAGMDTVSKAEIAGSVSRSTVLFTFYSILPSNQNGALPATITGVSENVANASSVKRGSDYLNYLGRQLERSAVPMVPSDTYSERVIGGKSFDWMDVTLIAFPAILKQRHYAARHSDTVIVIIQSYNTNEELAALDGVLDSIKFDW